MQESVLALWEHDVESNAVACVRRIAKAIAEDRIDWQAVDTRRRRMSILRRRNRLPKP